MIRLFVITLFVLLLTASVQAGNTKKDEKTATAIVGGINIKNPGNEMELMPEIPCETVSQPKVAKRCVDALFSYYDYYTFGLAHRQKVIWWQHLSSRIIFILVLGLVLVGVYFAWRQFNIGLYMSDKENEPSTSTIEISSQGIKVSSPVLGIIILTLSLGFFYLYLVFVYPIIEIL